MRSTGIYAWWDQKSRLSSLYPVGFPGVDPALPVYVGLANDDTLASRCLETHLAPKTRRSTLRRSLSALLASQLDLLDGATAHPKVKFSLAPEGDSRLTEWMLSNLRLTWVPHPQPGLVEREVVNALVPPLNDRFAHRAEYWRFMKEARQDFHRSIPPSPM